jgi:hypothetical protein
MEPSSQNSLENTSANPGILVIKSIETIFNDAIAFVEKTLCGAAQAIEKNPTLPCYICRKLYQEKCREALQNSALFALLSITDNNAVPDFRGAMLSWLATIASDYWPELSCPYVNCGCAAAAFERRSAKTVTPSQYFPPSSPLPPKLRCLHCNSTSDVPPAIGNPRQGLCLGRYADLDSHVGVIYG